MFNSQSSFRRLGMTELKDVQFFAGITDLWTSVADHPYLSFTVHFINYHCNLSSFCLNTAPLFDDHTGQNITDTIQDVLSNWGLQAESLIAVTTDNGSSFFSAFHNILEWPRISCFSHNLDLVINKALMITRVQRAIGHCHSLVELFSRSWKKNRDLHQKQSI